MHDRIGDRSLSPAPSVTNPDKVLYPRDGLTKTDIVDYYRTVAPVLLRHAADRPVVGQRWPDGIDEFTWYQHRVPPRAPDYLPATWVEGDRRIVLRGEQALLWLVNQAVITFHSWASRVDALAYPDWVIFDLDPGADTRWPTVVEVARAVRRALELLELPTVVKTSGQAGLHVLVPLRRGPTGERVQRFASLIAGTVARLLPDRVSDSPLPEVRRGRLYLDHLQGFVGKALVMPYSLRAVDGAPVSTPLRWEEVDATLDPRALGRREVLGRLERYGDLAAPLLEGGVDLEPALDKLGA
ncbi:MAG: non-homologous end-joining DNA ligase [Myxococcota bacterium]